MERAALTATGPVLVLAPSGRDGAIISSTLRRAEMLSINCADMECFCAELESADAGIIAEEALSSAAVACLTRALAAQPPWSDFPIVVLASPHRSSGIGLFNHLTGVANITLLERPMRSFTLVAVTRAALRARGRQHLTRRYLHELLRARENIARHRDELQEAVSKRTEELQATNQLLRLSERMASIGALAAGLGHDLANLLLPVRASLDAIERLPPEIASVHFARIRKSLDYIAKLAASLRLLALDPDGGRVEEEPETDLAGWWEDLTPMLQMALPKGTRLDADLEPGLRVRLAPHRLTQAVLNLVSNAGDAIRSTGALGAVKVAATRVPGDSIVRLSVSDNGPGMSEDVQRRCLEPLFTTGAHERSTGLGLSLVDGIVRAAGGEVVVESRLGVGTTITISLPAASEPRASERPGPLAVVSVEDARLRSILGVLLGRSGYLVERRMPRDTAPALWFTDPTEEAAKIAAALRERSPDLRIVVVGEACERWSRLGACALARSSPVSAMRDLIAGEAPGSAITP